MRRTPEVMSAVAIAAHHFGVRPDWVLQRGRLARPWCLARQLSVCLLRARCGWSWTEIGRALGIEHTTALHAFRRPWGPAEHGLVFAAYQRGNAERIRWGDHDA